MHKLLVIAIVSLLASRQAFPQDFQASYDLCMGTDNSDAAIEACGIVILNPGQLEFDVGAAFLSRGTKFASLERYDHAMTDYDKALLLQPEIPDWFLTRAALKIRLEQYELALEDYDDAVYLDPANVDTWFQRAQLNGMLGWYEDALADYTQVATLVPDSPIVYLYRAGAYSNLNDFAGALADYDRAILLDPNNAQAHNSQAWLLATANDASVRDGAKAVRLALRAVELQRDASYLDTLAAAYAEIEAYSQAARTQQEALDLLRTGTVTPEAIADYEARLTLYQSNMPYRE